MAAPCPWKNGDRTRTRQKSRPGPCHHPPWSPFLLTQVALTASFAAQAQHSSSNLKAAFFSLLLAIPFYFAGLFGGIWLLPHISNNKHDADVEAAMTGAFVLGPALFLLTFVIGLFRLRRSPAKRQ